MLALLSVASVMAAAPHQLVFEPVPPTLPVNAPYGVSGRAWVDGKEQPVGFQEILRVGDQPGTSPVPFGQLHDVRGDVFPPGRPPFSDLCNQLDYAAIQSAHGKLWLWTHFECVRGAIYLTELRQDSTTGTLTAVHTKPVDGALADEGGVFAPCAGDLTPWGTLLSSEEYEPDAGYWDEDAGQMTEAYWFSRSINRFVGAFDSPSGAHPYRFGWAPELRVVDDRGTVEAQKHYAMGRFSHEISRVLPDQRTVLQSDDGWGVGLFLFVADEAADLSAGHLYAAQWTITDPLHGGRGSLSWVPLGHARNDEIAPLLALEHPVRFDELFERVDLLATDRCPLGFTAVHTFGVTECLKLAAPSERVPDPAKAASRLESRRYAGLLGATTEWRKGEGLASTPDGETVYFAVSDVSGTMLAGEPAAAAPDTLRLESNRCGTIYAGGTASGLADTHGTPIDSAYVPWELHAAVVGAPRSSKVCDPVSISNPDNVTFLDGYDLLAIAEDTSRAPDSLWMWDRHLDTLTRVLLAPPEAEIAGLGFAPDLGGHAYVTVTLQSPGSDLDEAAPFDTSLQGKPYGVVSDDHRSVVGVFGPLPVP